MKTLNETDLNPETARVLLKGKRHEVEVGLWDVVSIRRPNNWLNEIYQLRPDGFVRVATSPDLDCPEGVIAHHANSGETWPSFAETDAQLETNKPKEKRCK